MFVSFFDDLMFVSFLEDLIREERLILVLDFVGRIIEGFLLAEVDFASMSALVCNWRFILSRSADKFWHLVLFRVLSERAVGRWFWR